MKFSPTRLQGAHLIELEKFHDDRGYFARSWCRREFVEHGLDPGLAQCSISFNTKRGTVRGMHYQVSPAAESKLVRCSRGALFDVILDLRPGSATFLQWLGVELTAENGKMLFIPEGFAHGFQTLADDTEIFYQISEFYSPQHARGVRWNDSLFGIQWPEPVTVISERDSRYPDANPADFHEWNAMREQQ
jgi:dTDP-4-dehydrorhamnose 3,5-epimerase